MPTAHEVRVVMSNEPVTATRLTPFKDLVELQRLGTSGPTAGDDRSLLPRSRRAHDEIDGERRRDPRRRTAMATPAATPTPPFPAGRRSRLGTALARRRNPLWRPSDSLRSRLRVLFVVGLLASVGVSAGFALALYQDDHAAALRRDAQLHTVQAVLLTAPRKAPASDPDAQSAVLARWSTSGGADHEAGVTVPDRATVGARIQLWLDHTGKVSAAPVTAADSATSAACLGVLLLLGSTGLVTGAHRVLRTWADRTDESHWEQDWRLFEPVWSQRS